MQVKALPVRLRRDSLSAHTEQTRFLEGEAGDRTQSDIRCGMTLVLIGSSHGETEPRKATYLRAGRRPKQNPDSIGDKIILPPKFYKVSGKSPGGSVVEVVTPKGTKQSNWGNE
jgi:hypothetical protein